MTTQTTRRKATPTGVLVLPASAPREEWLAERRHGIGASDIPKIVGLSTWGTALHVWADKTGRATDTGMNEAAEWGLLLEDTIARRWAEDRQVKVRRVGLVAHADDRWRRASLDRVVVGCPDGPCSLQVKTRSAWKAGAWADSVPDDVNAQVQWEMDVAGYHHCHVAVLVGGNTLRTHDLPADEGVQAFLRAEAELLWKHVLADTEPEVEPSGQLLGLLERMYEPRDGATEVGVTARGLIEDYRAAAAWEKQARDAKDTAKAALLALLGGAEVGLVGGTPALAYRAVERRSTDLAALARDWPAAYEACVRTTSSRTFRLLAEQEKGEDA